MSVSQPQQSHVQQLHQQQEQRRGDASRKASMAVGGGGRDEYEYEHELDGEENLEENTVSRVPGNGALSKLFNVRSEGDVSPEWEKLRDGEVLGGNEGSGEELVGPHDPGEKRLTPTSKRKLSGRPTDLALKQVASSGSRGESQPHFLEAVYEEDDGSGIGNRVGVNRVEETSMRKAEEKRKSGSRSANDQAMRQLIKNPSARNTEVEMEEEPMEMRDYHQSNTDQLPVDSIGGDNADRSRPKRKLSGRPTSLTVNKHALSPQRGTGAYHHPLNTLDEVDEEDSEEDDARVEEMAERAVVDVNASDRSHSRKSMSDGLAQRRDTTQPEQIYVHRESTSTRKQSRRSFAHRGGVSDTEIQDNDGEEIDYFEQPPYVEVASQRGGRTMQSTRSRQPQQLEDGKEVSQNRMRSATTNHSQDGSYGDANTGEEEAWQREETASEQRPIRVRAPHSTNAQQHSTVNHSNDAAEMFAEGISSFARERFSREESRRRSEAYSNADVPSDAGEITRDVHGNDGPVLTQEPKTAARRSMSVNRPSTYEVSDRVTARPQRKLSGRPQDLIPTHKAGRVPVSQRANRTGRLQTLDEINDEEEDEKPTRVSRRVSRDRSQQQRLQSVLRSSTREESRLDRAAIPSKRTAETAETLDHEVETEASLYAEGVASYAEENRGQSTVHRSSRSVAVTSRTATDQVEGLQSGDYHEKERSSRADRSHRSHAEYVDEQSKAAVVTARPRDSLSRDQVSVGRAPSYSRRQDGPPEVDTETTLFKEGVASFAAEAVTSRQQSSRSRSHTQESTRRHTSSLGRSRDEYDGYDVGAEGGRQEERSQVSHSHDYRHERQPNALHGAQQRQRLISASKVNTKANGIHYSSEEAEGTSNHRSRQTEGMETRQARKTRERDESSYRIVETSGSVLRSKSRLSNQVEHDEVRDSVRAAQHSGSHVDVRVHPSQSRMHSAPVKESATRNAHGSNQVEVDRTEPSKIRRLPPAPHPTMSGAAGQDYQKFRAASTQGGIVWPPGMEDEAKRIPMYHGKEKHPLVPPGMEHLVSDDQLVEYWTWLHWYSCWQLYYLQASSSHKKRAGKAAARKSEVPRRGVTANWYVSLSDH